MIFIERPCGSILRYIISWKRRLLCSIRELQSFLIESAIEENVQKLGCFAGIATRTAMSLLVEIGDFNRFKTAQQFSAYLGLVPGESSSGEKQIRTSITKAGNAHVRWLLTESAQHYGRGAIGKKSKRLLERQTGVAPEVVAYADKANERLKRKFYKIMLRSKRNIATTAVARELSCFIWGMMTGNIA